MRQRPQNAGSSSLEKSLTRQHDCDEAAKVSGGRDRKTLARRAWKKRNKDAAKVRGTCADPGILPDCARRLPDRTGRRGDPDMSGSP
ncbi:hypothetical protein G5714_011517 [Onychostoma macrolepis]|uniref:Uncharacterized protein n=1 Tax=Onychostoma macrolepis TaxID=369639 RepID=A0A7J6CKX0_9TELE|nr:hypothetical protein G5714_011517 [Onychostoma macrolepis]